MHRLLVKIIFTTFVCRKPTFSGVCTHFDSFLQFNYKFGTVYIFAYRFYHICSNCTKLRTELICLKEFFKKNWLP